MRGEQTLGVFMGLTLNTAQNDTIPIYNCQRPFSQKKKKHFSIAFFSTGAALNFATRNCFFCF